MWTGKYFPKDAGKNLNTSNNWEPLDMIKKGTDKYIDKIPGSSSRHEIQKIALCGTAHLLKDTIINVTGKYFLKDAGKI